VYKETGITDEKLSELEKDLQKSSFDEKTKYILIFARHAAEQGARGATEEKLINTVLQLGVSPQELTETAASISVVAEIIYIIHVLNLHKLDL